MLKRLLQQYQIKPNKRLGQNFLISQKILQKIIRAASLSPKDVVLEIGPGLGILTQALAQRVKKVVAIEKDKKIGQALKEILKDYQNVKIVVADALKIGDLRLNLENYKLIANLPYYITSPVIRMFLESENPPQEMILLIQKEVAQRICAKPPKMNLLAVSVQFYSQPKIISFVSKKSFWPQPKVDSAIIKIIPSPSVVTKQSRDKFFKIVKAGFASPRKQLINNLSQKLNLSREEIKKALTECNLDIQIRAANLSVDDWRNLVRAINDPGSPYC
jgi:16S rRNA (adenine1518-N6/adenine1519-N6)-dimethyltransferase